MNDKKKIEELKEININPKYQVIDPLLSLKSIAKKDKKLVDEPTAEIEENEDEWVPRIETVEQKQKRIAKDRVSGLLGDKLLAGWTMLGDHCPNKECQGV